MATTALLLDLGFLVLAFGGRTLVQLRRTGDTGWRLGRPHSRAELVARMLLAGAAVLLVVALPAGRDASVAPTAGIGIAVAALGIVVVLVAQLQMGASWRIGVDPGERTPLVVSGLYARIRNPIYTGMVLFTLGQVLLMPGPWTVAALVAMAVGVEIQVRAVEEPFLVATHGREFTHWAERAGRFVPGVGRGGRRQHRSTVHRSVSGTRTRRAG